MYEKWITLWIHYRWHCTCCECFLKMAKLQRGLSVLTNGLVQEKRNSIANALEFRLSCTKPSLWWSSPAGLAAQSLQNLRMTFKYGGRKNVPSRVEVEALTVSCTCCCIRTLNSCQMYENHNWLIWIHYLLFLQSFFIYITKISFLAIEIYP